MECQISDPMVFGLGYMVCFCNPCFLYYILFCMEILQEKNSSDVDWNCTCFRNFGYLDKR